MKLIIVILFALLASTGFVQADEAKATLKTQFAADRLIPSVEKQNNRLGFSPLDAEQYDCELAQDEQQIQLCTYKFNANRVLVRHVIGKPKSVARITVDLGDKTNRSDFDHLSIVMIKLTEPKMTDEAVIKLLFDLSANALSSGVNMGGVKGKNADYSLFVMGSTTQMLIDPKESNN